ncbi:tetratricopeptide repeat protein [Gammaproteobacteria bacterium]|nr:tetratricopeptide repeat protein [Gammaproteobacteria bacterium]
MKPSIDEALQRGVAAHKEGNLQKAERLYQAILQSQPLHPEANHNLGVLAVSVNKAGAALPLFKTAVTANPKKEQFWFSYIDALIKEQKFEAARQVIEQVKRKGMAADKLTVFEKQLLSPNQVSKFQSASQNKNPSTRISPNDTEINALLLTYQNKQFDKAEKLAISLTEGFPKHPFAWKILGALFGQSGRHSEAVKASQTAAVLSPQDADAHSNLGIVLKGLGRLDEAVASYTQAIELKPDFAEAHNNMGNTLKGLGRLDEAQASYTQAIALKPDFALAHYNLGNTLKELGKLDEAEGNLKQAITLKPDYAEAHNNLGITLKELGRLDEAQASYTQAIALKPDFAEAHNNMGNTLKELGRLDEAVAGYSQAIALKPDYAEAYINLGIAIKNVSFNSSNRQLYPLLIYLLTTGNLRRPTAMAVSILSLLKHDPLIKEYLLEKNFATSLEEATSIITSLDKLSLLHHLMRVCPLPDLQFEGLFVTIRSLLLKNLDNIEVSPEIIYFLSTLSLHCFTNEYVYIESDEEAHLIGELQAKISQTVAQSEQPEAIKILCFASYRPLHQYDWCQKLESLDNLEEVKKRLIEEPLLEKMIAKGIPVLEEISDDVSLKVREQYEESPYPRWVQLAISIKAKPIAAVCDELKLRLHSENVKNVTAPFILIAGCGTGQHSIETATRFSDCQVTAVDLSLPSLAYAQRKANELGITNLEHLQADILKLDQLKQEFDIIESSGVLHHMDEPMAGWRVLVDLLKPGGLMKIGVYSELARQHIVEVRKEIAALGLGTSEDDMRKFRQSLAESHDENHQLLTTSTDFFSLSELRDLIFHFQEHRFTLPQIKNYLDELGLKFCGFEAQDIVSRFRQLHGEEADICNLLLWHQYEETKPFAFVGMYQFWCQKI